MRIISGKYKGHSLEGFELNGTRPTMDRVKESLFAIIQNKIKNSICLDLFAGSGALGLEALSNGAKSCYFVDINPMAIQTIQTNVKQLHVQEETFLLCQSHQKALKLFAQQGLQFDCIFLDPPYQEHLIQECLNIIIEAHLLKENGIVICEYETEKFDFDYLNIKDKKYGKKKVRIYQRITKHK